MADLSDADFMKQYEDKLSDEKFIHQYESTQTEGVPVVLGEQSVAVPAEGESYWGDVAENAWPSTKRLVSDTAAALASPLETIGALSDVGAGAAAKLGIGDADQTQTNALMDFYANRYGSLEGFQEAFRTDPAGIVSDIAGAVTGGAGLVSKGAGLASNSARMAKLSKFASGVSDAASTIDPITGALRATQGVAKLAKKAGAPEAIMKAVTKPGVNDPKGLSATLLRENVPINNKGLDVLQTRASGINTQIDNILADTANKVDAPLANELYKPSDAFMQKYLDQGRSTNADKALKTVLGEAEQFPKQFNSIEDVQAFKKNLYGGINWKSDKFKTKVKNDYLRDVASNSRLAIEDAARQGGFGDEIRALNKREGLLLEARKPLERTIHRVTNRNPIGLTSMLSGLGAGGVFNDPMIGLLATGGTQALLNPRMGARMAQGAYNLGSGPGPRTALMRTGIGATRVPGILEEEEEAY